MSGRGAGRQEIAAAVHPRGEVRDYPHEEPTARIDVGVPSTST